MPFESLREFIASLEKTGELQRISEEVDWNLEVGAMVRRANQAGLPAPLFQKIKGYPEGYRILGTPLGNHRRVAIAMDLPPDTHPRELIDEYLRRRKKPIKPVVVKTGPCKENIQLGDEVDLLKFPVPLIHAGDGGRYIGTFHFAAVRDPDSDWVNWAMQRHMLHNKNTIGIEASPHTHFGMIYMQKYEPRNRVMEVAICIGIDPLSAFCAATSVPYGVSEMDIAGGIRGKPLELVKCETIDMLVPASAEIVIEGELRPHERMEEGPFGEYTGYMATLKGPRPVIHVKAVTHRNNPILTMTCEGVPTTDTHAITSITRSAELWEALKEKGFPVTGVFVHPESCAMCPVVAIKPPYANVAADIAYTLWSGRIGRAIPYVIVVEDDVDPFDLGQVYHAIISKCHPFRGINRQEHTGGMIYFPWASEHERRYLMGSKVYFDCTWPKDWNPEVIPKKSSFEKVYPPEVQEQALAKWHKYGY